MEIYNRDHEWWQKALDLAKFGEHRVRVGAFAVVGGVPVAGAWNRIRNTSQVDFRDISIHAEMACLNQVSRRLWPKTTLYVARINMKGQIMPSHPCERCQSALKARGVKALCVYDQGFLMKYKLV